MRCRWGMTLMEIVIVLMMVAIATIFIFPNFTTPMEHARAVTVQNNLLAIYTAEQNYNNNNGTYVYPSSLSAINTTFTLDLQDDGTYIYFCSGPPPAGTIPVCRAVRNNPVSNLVMIVTLNQPIQLGGGNPTCTSTTSNTNWCP